MTAAYSLRGRLLAILLVATVLIAMVALVDIWREAQATARSLSDRVLAGAAMAIAEKVTLDENGGLDVEVPFSALEMLASPADDKVFYRVDDQAGALLTGYPELRPAETGPSDLGFTDALIGDDAVRSATVRRALSTGSRLVGFSVTVAETNQARDALARTILWRSLLRLGALMTATMAIVWLGVTVALRPLDRIGAAMAARSPDDLEPLALPVPREALPLLNGMNSFTARLSMALGALRNFTGNASHQLRTPLSVIGTQLALARRSGSDKDRETALSESEAALARAERVLAQLLVLARLDASNAKVDDPAIDITELSRSVVAEFIPAAVLRGCDLGHEGDSAVEIRAEPVLLGEMLRNLVDNALNHTRPGTVITVRTLSVGGRPRLTIEDNGPGMPPGVLAKWSKGQRMNLQPPVSNTSGGSSGRHGLGLSIVSEIAARFGAEVEISSRPAADGTTVTVTFP
jgi:two-component system, OmpR family, sensor histidine kinase TctE